MSATTDAVETIEAQFENSAVDVDTADIKTRLDTLVHEYQVPAEEARRSVVNSLLDDNDIDRNAFYGQSSSNNEQVGCGEIDEDEQWINVQAQVVELWEPNSEKIAQVGLLGDDTGTVKFVAFETSNLPTLAEGDNYHLENVVTDKYEGRYSVKLNRTTEITLLEDVIDVADRETTRAGMVVAIQPGSGLIKRCPTEDCTRVLDSGRCGEHGDVEGEFDLRIKAVLDDGQTASDLLFDQEQTEAIMEMSLEAAIERAMDALDTQVVADHIEAQLVGRYLEVEGPEIRRYLLVNEMSERGAPTTDEIDALQGEEQ
jgi:replication factor A1